MRKLILIPLLLLLLIDMPGNSFAQELKTKSTDGEIVEVFYFHYTRRCATCNAVEKETENAINENFAGMKAEGRIVFLSVDVEQESNKDLIDLLEISGQTLLVKKGEKKVDITNKAFMNAQNPEKMKKEVVKAIESVF